MDDITVAALARVLAEVGLSPEQVGIVFWRLGHIDGHACQVATSIAEGEAMLTALFAEIDEEPQGFSVVK